MSKLVSIAPVTLTVKLSFTACNGNITEKGNTVLRKGYAELIKAEGIDAESVKVWFDKGGNGDLVTIASAKALKKAKVETPKAPAKAPAPDAMALLASLSPEQIAAILSKVKK